MTCLFNGYSFEKRDEAEDFINYVSDNGTLQKSKEISFEEIKEAGMEKAMLESVEWIEQQIIFALNILDEYGTNEIGNKRKVSAIIDSL